MGFFANHLLYIYSLCVGFLENIVNILRSARKEQKFLPSHSLAGHNRVRDRRKPAPSSNKTFRAPVAIGPKSIQM